MEASDGVVGWGIFRWARSSPTGRRIAAGCAAIPSWTSRGGRALAESLRINSTATSLNLSIHDLGEGGERALAEALRLNATLTSLNLYYNGLGEGVLRALADSLRRQRHCSSTACLRRSTLAPKTWERAEGGCCRDTAPQHHGNVAEPSLEWPGRGRR
jgi:hypothetical protein